MSEQNIYDDPYFFEGYKKLRDNEQGFNSLLEQPILHSLLPTLENKIVCDLGCGFGDFCRYAIKNGAKKAIGLEISEKMLSVAKSKTTDSRIFYVNESIEQYDTTRESVDMVVSSLALHYVADLKPIFTKIYNWLCKNGEFIFTVEHPICTANHHCETVTIRNSIYWVLNNYGQESEIHQKWFVENVKKYHRKISTYINLLLDAGFILEKIYEPTLSDAEVIKNPNVAIHQVRPPLLAVKVIKA